MTAGEFNLMKMLMQVLANQGVLLAAASANPQLKEIATEAQENTLALINHAKEIMGR